MKRVQGDSTAGQDRGGPHYQDGSQILFKEIQHGLQLNVVYKKVPTLEETKLKFPNFHSRKRHLTGKESLNRTAHILLFKDLESLESAKSQLDDDLLNVQSTDYVGMRSAENQANSVENRRIYLKFDVSPDRDTVEKFDSGIEDVQFLKDKTTLFVQFPSYEVAAAAVKPLTDKIGTDGLLLVFESLGMKRHAYALSGIQSNQVVLRDVPKTATLKDIIQSFPDAIQFVTFDKTFPASTFCHAVLRFKETQRVTEILAQKEYTIMGKKVYAVPAHSSLLQNHPKLGLKFSDETKAANENEIVSVAPFNKKMKLDAEDANYGQEDDDSWEDMDSDEENGEGENEGSEDEDGDAEGGAEEEE